MRFIHAISFSLLMGLPLWGAFAPHGHAAGALLPSGARPVERPSTAAWRPIPTDAALSNMDFSRFPQTR
jgi:hypothetical protein